MPLTRRAMLELLSSSTFFLTAGSVFASGTPRLQGSALVFPQGVASGDPQADALMLWTRAEPVSGATSATLLLQVSRDETFTELVLEHTLQVNAADDFTLRAYVDGLQADRHYYYRFLGPGDSRSRVGRSRTAPAAGQARRANLAFASCQNYEQGHYGAWARMLADDLAAPEEEQIDFVLHLGDFIYERAWDTLPGGAPPPRPLPPFPDGAVGEGTRHAVTLADYRYLYRTYLADPDLQAARARWPFICTWDDHEFSNDNFGSYSTYGGTPRAEAQRKLDANQAWFEYIPCVLDELQAQPAHDFRAVELGGTESERNRQAVDSLRIYRRLSWGSQLDLLITDSRSYRTPPCVPPGLADSLGQVMNPVQLVEITDAGRRYNAGKPPATLPYGDGSVANPARAREPGTILGSEQRDWFLQQLRGSQANWKLWGNALPMMPMRVDLGSIPFSDYEDAIFHLDPWAGYPHEQALLMSAIEQGNISGLVSLSGDHHLHAAGTLRRSASAPEEPALAVDFAVAGISSTPMFDELYHVARESHPDFMPLVATERGGKIVPVWNMTMLQGVLASFAYARAGLDTVAGWLGPNRANPGLRYMDSTANGYGLAHFHPEELQVTMVTVDRTPEPFTAAPAIAHAATFRLPLWQPGEEPLLEGPIFEHGAPFPFTYAGN
jgi:alkaline phosphatase D